MSFTGYTPNDQLPLKKGDVVTICKGVLVRTTRPSRRPHGGGHPYVRETAGRTYKIVVDHVLNGTSGEGVASINPSVRWPGSGGYWCEVDINDIPEAQKLAQ